VTHTSVSTSDAEEAEYATSVDTAAGNLVFDTALITCKRCVLIYTERHGGKDSEVPHINKGTPSLSIFLLQFTEIITRQVVETNRNYNSYSDAVGKRLSALAYRNEAIIFVFLAITIQMCHCLRDKLIDYWTTVNLFYGPSAGARSNETSTRNIETSNGKRLEIDNEDTSCIF